MQSLSNNHAIIAVAGARKTQSIIDEALSDSSQRTLVTTYTTENLRQIVSRIQAHTGVLPPHVRVAGWFSFLLSEAIRPYQHSVFGQTGIVRGLNFEGQRHRFARRGTREYYLDRNRDVYRGGMSDLACYANDRSGGDAIGRLEDIYDRILIDEVQDLVGYDLDFLDLLFASRIVITVVGDPRQYMLATNQGSRYKKYRGVGLVNWFNERLSYCHREDRTVSARCHQGICDFASALFPELPALTAESDAVTGHDGIHFIVPGAVHEYVAKYRPAILRHSKVAATMGYPAMNIGVAKGSTFDRVLIFPTRPMQQYLRHRDISKLKSPERLYVAVTRARHSACFVV